MPICTSFWLHHYMSLDTVSYQHYACVNLNIADIMAHCSTPLPPRNGTIRETRDRKGNKMVQFACDEGYILVGSDVLICDGNGWNGSSPCCEVTSELFSYFVQSKVNSKKS